MRSGSVLCCTVFLFSLLTGPCFAQINGSAASDGVSSGSGEAASDPLAMGKAALEKSDFKAAKAFFSGYTESNPQDAEAWFYLGGTNLGLNQPADAAQAFEKTVALRPDAWDVHSNLELAYAEAGNWPGFDREQAVLKAARDAKKPGVELDGHDVIDVLRVHGQAYQVWYFYKPYGKFHARYVFLHFTPEGKADKWIQCESDDVDQMFFRQKHPKEAAAGERSYSLDSYWFEKSSPYPSQALNKFYPDGEPTYETVRRDVLTILSGQSKPAATMSGAGK